MSTQSQKTIFITGSSSGLGRATAKLFASGKDQLRYVAADDAKATYAMHLRVGAEEFRKAVEQQFFGT